MRMPNTPGEEIRDVSALLNTLRPLLAGKDPSTIGAALADLTATWIAAHTSAAGKAETDQLRNDLLAMHIEAIKQLIPINARQLKARRAGGAR